MNKKASNYKKSDEGKRQKEVNDFDKLSVLICFTL